MVAPAQLVAVVGAGALAVRAVRSSRADLARACLGPALIAVYLAAFLATDPTGTEDDTLRQVMRPNDLRYHAPFVPLAALVPRRSRPRCRAGGASRSGSPCSDRASRRASPS